MSEEESLNEEEMLKKITKALTLSKNGFYEMFEEKKSSSSIIELERFENITIESKEEQVKSPEMMKPVIQDLEEIQQVPDTVEPEPSSSINSPNLEKREPKTPELSPRGDLTNPDVTPIENSLNVDDMFVKTRPRAKRTVMIKKDFNLSFSSLNDPLELKKKKSSKSMILSSAPLLSLCFEITSFKDSEKRNLIIYLFKLLKGTKIGLGTTEPSTSSKFKKSINVNYNFQDVQEISIEIKDYDTKESYGEGRIFIGNLIKNSLSHELEIFHENEPTGTVLIKASQNNPYIIDEKIKSETELYADFDVSADMRFRGDYSIQVYMESTDVSFSMFHKSEVQKKTKTPIWKTFSFELNKKVATDKKYMKIEVLFEDKVVGKVIGTYSSWRFNKKIDVFDQEKVFVGSIATSIRQREVILQQMNYKYSFIDYIKHGTKLSLSFGIDFSICNLPPRQYTNLHELRQNEINEYEQMIYSFTEIMSQYNPTIKMYSIGAKSKNNELFTCISDNISDPKKTYRDYVKNVEFGSNLRQNCLKLSGPNEFYPLLEYFLQKHTGDTSTYHILVLLIPNDFINLSKTISYFISCANQIPISIIIIGIGNCAFKTLKSINPNPKVKVERAVQYFYRNKVPYSFNLKKDGIKACREVFQFTTLNSEKNVKEIAKNMLIKIPVQIVKFMLSKGLEPK